MDGAGIELPSLYKWIESQAPHGCCTEAWRNRTQWVGSELTNDLTGVIADAENYLQSHRPVERQVTPLFFPVTNSVVKVACCDFGHCLYYGAGDMEKSLRRVPVASWQKNLLEMMAARLREGAAR